MTFAAQLQAFADKAKLNTDMVVQKITLDVAKSVIEKSPVGNPELWASLNPYTDLKTKKTVLQRKAPAGYVGGRFRANWMFGDGKIDTTTTDETDRSGSMTKTRLATAINATKAGGVTFISNSLPYAIPLEYGHSSQAPQGMVRNTVTEFQQYINRATQGLK